MLAATGSGLDMFQAWSSHSREESRTNSTQKLRRLIELTKKLPAKLMYCKLNSIVFVSYVPYFFFMSNVLSVRSLAEKVSSTVVQQKIHKQT